MWIILCTYFIITIISIMLALNNIRIVSQLNCKVTRNFIVAMMVLVVMKYIGYSLFGIGVSQGLLEVFKRTLLFASIGIVFSMILTVRHLYKKGKIGITKFLILLSPFMLFYVVMIIGADITIIPSTFVGYGIEIEKSWLVGQSMIQGVVLVGLYYYVFRGMSLIKDINGKMRLLFMLVPLCLYTLEGISMLLNIPFFQPLTVTELVALLSIGYGLSYQK